MTNLRCGYCAGLGWVFNNDGYDESCPVCNEHRAARSKLKPVSDKKKEAKKRSKKFSDAMRELLDGCEMCGSQAFLERHHICAGAHRRENANPRTLLFLCRECHEELQGAPIDKQYVVACESIKRAINDNMGRNCF